MGKMFGTNSRPVETGGRMGVAAALQVFEDDSENENIETRNTN